MILMDVNVLVYAHREDTANHPAYRDWLEEQINGAGAYGVSEKVISFRMLIMSCGAGDRVGL